MAAHITTRLCGLTFQRLIFNVGCKVARENQLTRSPVYLEVAGRIDDTPAGFCCTKMRLLIHSARQVVTITNEDVFYLSGRAMKSVEVLQNSDDGVAVAIDE